MLNKTPIHENLPEQLRRVKKNNKGEQELNISTKYFQFLSNIVEESDLIGRKKPRSMIDIDKLTRKEVTNSNVVPIGILNADVTLLTEAQVKENIDSKSKGKNADNSKYENFEIMVAGLLQEEIFQGNVSFQISKDLIHSNKINQIDHIEIDFYDNKGWRSYELKDQLIKHQFNSTGGQTIAIKIVTKKGNYIAYCPIKIVLLTRPQPSFVGKVSAEKVKQEVIKGAKVGNTVAGAEFVIFPSCDNVFDKPIIIAEGFDISQNVDINDLLDKYYDELAAFRQRGFDLVFVNYDNGRDYIENNAQALKLVIQQVNNLKQGNHKLVVIGESMSGLVARFAIRELEQQGQTHNVGHFVSFDSPQRGANVPVGMVRAKRFSQNLFFPWFFHLNEFNNWFDFVPALTAMDTPAARQMLLTHQQQNGPHPDFINLQNTLNNMGYPSQNGIRNIAVLSGSLDQTFQQFGFDDPNDIQPGNRIVKARYPFFPFVLSIDIWTNNIAQNTRVFEAIATVAVPPVVSTDYSSFRNLDRLPGGYIGDFDVFGLDIASRFSFVPTFSSIDFRGPLNNDAEHNIQIAGNIIDGNFQVTNPNLTPFNAIYGWRFQNFPHAVPIIEIFDNLLQQEFPNTPLLVCNAPTSCGGGNFYGHVDNINCDIINGWMFDNNNLGRTVEAQIFVDGQYFASITANENRYDLASAFGNNAAIPHGFTYQVPVNAPWKNGQPHTIVVKPCGQSSGTFVSATATLTCGSSVPQPPNCANGNFNGFLDTYNCDFVSGWVIDFNDFNRTVNADVYIDGVFFGTVAANQVRTDLGAAFGNPAANPHGYTFSIPANAAWKDGQQHSVSIKPCGGANYLNNSGQTLVCQGSGGGSPPTGTCGGGNYNGHVDIVSCDEISGWLFDWNDLNKTCIAQIYVDGNIVGSTDANLNRYDLGPAFNNNAAIPHGFTYHIPSNASWKNGQLHTIVVKPCGGLNNVPNPNPLSISCTGGNLRIAAEKQKQEETTIEEVSKETKMLPNPTNGKATILYYLEADEKVVIDVLDAKGAKLKTADYEGKQGQNKFGIDLSSYESGIYLININSQQKRETLKVFKE